MTLGVIKQSGDACEFVNASNVHDFVQTELHCLQVSVDKVIDMVTLSYIFGNVQTIHKLHISGYDARDKAFYDNVISLWAGRGHRRRQCVVHELVLSMSRSQNDAYTLRNLDNITTPLKALRVNGSIDLVPIDTSQLEVLEMKLCSPENATNLAEVLEANAFSNLKYLRLKETIEMALTEEASDAFCHKFKCGLPRLKALNVAVNDNFPPRLLQFAASVPATVQTLNIEWKREGSPNSISELAPAVPQLSWLLIDLKARRLDPCQLYEGLLPIFGALSQHRLKHLSIGPAKKALKCDLLHNLLTILSNMTSLESLKLLLPMRLDTKCCDAIIQMLVRNARLRNFSYPALMGPQHFQRKIQWHLKLNRLRYHDVLAKGKLPLTLWPRLLAKIKPGDHDLVFHLLQHKNDELIASSFKNEELIVLRDR